jgi:NADH-quinone oxidoreductase subunit M
MALFITLLAGGWALIDTQSLHTAPSVLGIAMLIEAVLVRSGCVPVHCWMTDLFEKATLGTALLYVAPMPGAYAAVRLVLPVAPDWALRTIALASLFTAVYAAGMALVQREARRFVCYLLLSNSSLVLVGLETVTAIGLTGSLCLWLSVSISLVGFGLTLRAAEARTGRLSLVDYHGLYEHMPTLGTFFLLTGLASIGFPGTIGFVGAELLIEAAVHVYPFVGSLVVVAAALNGVAVMHAYFRLFTGKKHASLISLRSRPTEKFAVLVLTALILGGGVWPQPSVVSRYHAATEIIRARHPSLARARDGMSRYEKLAERKFRSRQPATSTSSLPDSSATLRCYFANRPMTMSATSVSWTRSLATMPACELKKTDFCDASVGGAP